VSFTNRSVNGVSTGRGADTSIFTASPSGLAAVNCCSSVRFSASDVAIAVIATESAAIEIFDRGNSFSASMP